MDKVSLGENFAGDDIKYKYEINKYKCIFYTQCIIKRQYLVQTKDYF